MTLEEAINIAVKKNVMTREKIQKELLKGNYNIIPNDNHAKEFVLKFSPNLIAKKLYELADIESTIKDILDNEEVNESEKSNYLYRRFTNIFRKKEPYLLKNNKVFTSDILRDYMINSILNIRENNNKTIDVKNKMFDIKTEEEAFEVVSYYKDDRDYLNDIIDNNNSLSDILIKKVIDCYYLNKKENTSSKIIMSLSDKYKINPKNIFEALLNDNCRTLNFSNEDIDIINNIEINDLKLELIINALNLYKYTNSNQFIFSIEEAYCYAGKGNNKNKLINNMYENSFMIKNMLKMDIHRLKEYLDTLSFLELYRLIDLFINSNENKDTLNIVETGRKLDNMPETINLETILKSKEIKDLLCKEKRI